MPSKTTMPVDKLPARILSLVILVMILSACATSPPEEAPLVIVPEQPEPQVTEEPAAEPEPSPTPLKSRPPPPEPHKPCAWSQIRGVATLTGVAQKQDVTEGTWQFFPGDEVMFHPVPDDASKGDEYKALLRRPLSGDCEHPRLIIVSPV